MNFGENIRTARRRLNWTQEELARKVGCTKPAVSKWEANKAVPLFSRVKILGELLDIDPDTLFASISTESITVKGSNLDQRLMKAWEKLSPLQRTKLLQIAEILSK